MKLLAHLFALEAEETPRVAWLLLHSICVGFFVAFFFSTGNALLLEHFTADLLPWGYMAAGVYGFVAVRFFSWLRPRVSLTTLSVAYLVSLIVGVGGVWAATFVTDNRWLFFVLFLQVSPSLTLLNLEFWGLAGRLFDLRQGKRLFGLVSSGEVLSAMVGFFLVRFLAEALGSSLHLLPIAVASLMVTAVVVVAMRWRFPEALGDGDATPTRIELAKGAAKSVEPTRPALFGEPYFLLAATVMGCYMVTLYLVDFSYLSELRANIPGPELAGFIGVFFGGIKVCELLMKTLASGRILQQFGLLVALLMLPGSLLLCVMPSIFTGLAGGVEGNTLFFVLIAAGKLVWMVVRKGVFDPAFKVIYQPLPPDLRITFQANIEGQVRQGGMLASGLLLLLMSRGGASSLTLSMLLVPILAIWMGAIFKLHQSYRARLLTTLAQVEPQPLVVPRLAPLRDRLRGASPAEALATLALLNALEPRIARRMTGELVSENRLALADLYTRPELAELAETIAAERYARAMIAGEEHSASDETVDLFAEVAALAIDPERLQRCARSADAGERRLAAEAIGFSCDPRFRKLLKTLLWDRQPSVRHAAVAAAGRIGAPELWTRLLAHLADPHFAGAAAVAIRQVGEPILDEMEIAWSRAGDAPGLRLRILRLWAQLATPRALDLLVDKLSSTDKGIRQEALEALVIKGQRVTGATAALVRDAVEDLAADRTWNLAALRDLGTEDATRQVRRSLRKEIGLQRRQLFLLLAVLYDHRAIGLVWDRLQAAEESDQAFALEVLEILIEDELRPFVLPFVEDSTPEQVLKRMAPHFPSPRLTVRDRLAALVLRERARIYIWNQAAALEAIGEMARRDGQMAPELLALLYHPDPYLAQIAARHVHAVDRSRLGEAIVHLPLDLRIQLERIFGRRGQREAEGFAHRSIVGRIALLDEHETLARLPWYIRRTVAARFDERVVRSGRRWPPDTDRGVSLCYVVEGGFEDIDVAILSGWVIFGPGSPPRSAAVDTRVLHLPSQRLRQLLGDFPELVLALLEILDQLPAQGGHELPQLEAVA